MSQIEKKSFFNELKKSPSFNSYLSSPYKSIKHSTYFHSYDHFFNQFRNKEITFVEIGVLDGGSLFMWRDYFGSKARVIGVDLNPEANKWKAEGFEIFIGNQSDENFWKKFSDKVGPIDIILDDGGHTYEQQIITTECLLDTIKDGGMILIEDTHTSYMDGFGPRKKSFIKYTKNLIDLINMRFSIFNNKRSEKRIWSIEMVESMVAFKINRTASNLISERTKNNGKSESSEDYRHFSNTPIRELQKFAARNLNTFKYIPFAKLIFTFIKNRLINRKFKAGKYFK